MNRTLRLWLAIWVPMLLIGHGGSLPCCDEGGVGCKPNCDPLCDGSIGGTIEYDVVSNCGPSGRVTLSKRDDQCELRIEGDDVGLATTSGFAGAAIADGWRTDTPQQSCMARPISDTRLAVTCTQVGLTCRAFFIRSDQQCAVGACSVPLCLGDTTLSLGESDCCPVCVLTPSDSGGVPVDAGNEAGRDAALDLDSGSDEPLWCEVARAEHEDQYATLSSLWRACAVDDDCTLTDIDSDCASHCSVALNADIYEGDTCDAGECLDLEELLDDTASDLCNGCAAPPGCLQQPAGEARCINNQCTLITTP